MKANKNNQFPTNDQITLISNDCEIQQKPTNPKGRIKCKNQNTMVLEKLGRLAICLDNIFGNVSSAIVEWKRIPICCLILAKQLET